MTYPRSEEDVDRLREVCDSALVKVVAINLPLAFCIKADRLGGLPPAIAQILSRQNEASLDLVLVVEDAAAVKYGEYNYQVSAKWMEKDTTLIPAGIFVVKHYELPELLDAACKLYKRVPLGSVSSDSVMPREFLREEFSLKGMDVDPLSDYNMTGTPVHRAMYGRDAKNKE